MRARLSLIRARRSVRMRKSFWILAAPGRAGTRGWVGTLRAAEATHGELEGQSDAAPALKVATPFSSSSVAIEVLSSSLLPLSSSMHCQAQMRHMGGRAGRTGPPRSRSSAPKPVQSCNFAASRRPGLPYSSPALCWSARGGTSFSIQRKRRCQERAFVRWISPRSVLKRYSIHQIFTLPLVPTEKASARYARAPRATKHASTHVPQISAARDSPSASLAEVREPAGRPRHRATLTARTCPPPTRRRRCCSRSSWAAAPSYSGRPAATRPPARSSRTRPTCPPPAWSKGDGADFARGRLEHPVLMRAARHAAGAESRRGEL